VDYAKLQEEFASMEKEYLAMYNAMHGNNGWQRLVTCIIAYRQPAL
jgi:hypothetical protein